MKGERFAVAADDLLDQHDLAGLLGWSVATLRAARSQPERNRKIDGLPNPLRMIGNAPVWDTGKVLLWWARSAPTVLVPPSGVPDWAEGRTAKVVGIERGTRWVVVFDVDGRRMAQEWPHVQGWLHRRPDDRPAWLREADD